MFRDILVLCTVTIETVHAPEAAISFSRPCIVLVNRLDFGPIVKMLNKLKLFVFIGENFYGIFKNQTAFCFSFSLEQI